MPLKPIDYANGLQYKIVCKDPTITDCYNGSTCSLKDRKKSHKKSYINPNDKAYNLKIYRFIREHGGWDNWTFLQIEEYPCKNKQELVLRERHWFDIIKPTLNSYSPTLNIEKIKKTRAEYANEHKVELAAKHKEYNTENRVELAAYKKQYYTDNKVEIAASQKQYCTDNKDKIAVRHKQYYANNNATFLAKANQYKEEHRAEINAKQREKVTCECGCVTNKSNMKTHQKTPKHLHIMNQLK
jgi:hypothetical protein